MAKRKKATSSKKPATKTPAKAETPKPLEVHHVETQPEPEATDAKEEELRVVTGYHPEFGKLPEDVAVVYVPVPLYLGKVQSDRPLMPDQMSIKFPTIDQRVGINRLFGAVTKLNIRDGAPKYSEVDVAAHMTRRGESTRWLFGRLSEMVDRLRAEKEA